MNLESWLGDNALPLKSPSFAFRKMLKTTARLGVFRPLVPCKKFSDLNKNPCLYVIKNPDLHFIVIFGDVYFQAYGERIMSFLFWVFLSVLCACVEEMKQNYGVTS